MKLVTPHAAFAAAYVEACRAALPADAPVPVVLQEVLDDFDSWWAATCADAAEDTHLPDGSVFKAVPIDEYWLVDGETVLGWGHLTPRLNAQLENIGGHIGYTIRADRRGQGLGHRILALLLEKARDACLPRVLITCNAENTASARVIEGAGGVLENTVIRHDSGQPHHRYWVTL